MRIERNYDTTVPTYNVTADGDDGLEKTQNIDHAVVRALVRRGMQAQLERDRSCLALLAHVAGMTKINLPDIDDSDITAALTAHVPG